MQRFPCPYLHAEVELTEERRQHILVRHPDFFPEYLDHFAITLADPDEVRRDTRFPATYLFSHWFDNVIGGKFIVVAVVSDTPPDQRHWVVSAYIARKLTQGEIEWKRS